MTERPAQANIRMDNSWTNLLATHPGTHYVAAVNYLSMLKGIFASVFKTQNHQWLSKL
jgi:hypothetical protein